MEQSVANTLQTDVQLEPVGEVLGSVTTFNNTEGLDQTPGGKNCHQLRTSARVIKKLKLDNVLINSNSNQEKDKKDAIPTKEDIEKIEKTDTKVESKPKSNRSKEVWSTEDKNHFFDAVKEYGKDFDAIHDYIISKCKKKGIPESAVKTKDQVRHFYYRTWQKISKHLKFSDDVKKVAQEYYALINYGELRRKIGVMNEKTCVKLNELMYRGAIQLRIRGRTIRIKTPMCRALRKLNQLDEKSDELRLPGKVIVELRPRDMDTWMHVQNMGQNPRVRCVMPLQKRLHVLLACLNSRWRTHSQIIQEKLQTSYQSTTSGSNSSSTEPLMGDKKFPLDATLRFAPSTNCQVEVPMVNFSEYITSCGISLNAYEERMGIKNRGEALWLSSGTNFKGGGKATLKRGNKRTRTDSLNEKLMIKKETVDTDCDMEVSDVVDSVVNTILALKHDDNNCESDSKPDEELLKITAKTENEEIKKEQKELAVDTIKKGWVLQDADSITIGELYLMIGSNSKISLEYWWEPVVKEEEAANNEEMCKSDIECIKSDSLSSTLQKLLSLAKLQYRKEKIQCPCGHVCSSTIRNAVTNRNKASPMQKNVLRNIDNKLLHPDISSNLEESVSSMNSYEPVFRRPILPHPTPLRPNSNLEEFKAQLDSLKPKYCNRRGRNVRSKQVVVQRMLPLLPKAPVLNNHSIVTMKVIQQGSLGSDFVPIAPKPPPAPDVVKPLQQSVALSPIQLDEPIQETSQVESLNDEVCPEKILEHPDSTTIHLNPPSPTPTISTLLDLELSTESPRENAGSNLLLTDSVPDISNFTGLISNSQLSNVTPPSSPSRIFKENDTQWLNSEVADFSLSSFLGHLESPLKPSGSISSTPIIEDTRMSQDMEAQLQSLLIESSIDYMAKFADLAAQVASDMPKK